MSDLLPPPENSSLPWSRLTEAGWRIKHFHHTAVGNVSIWISQSASKSITHNGPDTPVFWQELEVKAGIEKRAALTKKQPDPKDPRHAELMGVWSGAFLRQFGSKYVVQGAADGVAVKRFLTAQPELTVNGIMSIAREAWEHQEAQPFCRACKRSLSLASFLPAWNEIVAELQTAKPKSTGSNFTL